MKKRLTALAAAVAILATAACGGHGSGGVTPATGNTQPYTGPASLANFDWGKNQLQGAALVGPANLGHMQVNAIVNQQNAQGLIEYAREASDPASPVYRHFLTPQQIGQEFGASQQDYQKAANYFVSQGLSVAGWPQHLILSVAGPQPAMERAFGTKFGMYEKNGVQFAGPIGTPHFASAVPVTAVANMVTYNRTQRYIIIPPRANVNDSGAGYSPQQLRTAFDFSGAIQRGFNGTGITVGIIGTGPLNVTAASPCADKDLAALQSMYGIVVAKVCQTPVTPTGVAAGLVVSGIPTAAPAPTPSPNQTPHPNPSTSPTSMFPFSGDFQTPPPVTSGGCTGSISNFPVPRKTSCNPEDGEAQLDTQQVATLAPNATVNFYLAYNASDCFVYFPNSCATPAPSGSPGPSTGYPASGLVEADAEVQQAIADDTADVVSVSFGGGEPDNVGNYFNANGVGFGPEEYAALAAEGIAVFISSGDSGVTGCSTPVACVQYPAGDVNVTSVGGVNAPINELGQISGNLTAWGNTNGGNGSAGGQWGGSGGGVSTIFNAPSWQQTATGATKREQPDVSMDGDPLTGVTIVTNTGLTSPSLPSGPFAIGGTSVSAPEMAAMWALVLDACKVAPACNTAGPVGHTYRLGNAAPYLYSIYHGSGLVPGSAFTPALPYPSVFYDVVYGENGMPGSGGSFVVGEKAGPGYDMVTGIGVPFAGHLIQAITGKSVP